MCEFSKELQATVEFCQTITLMPLLNISLLSRSKKPSSKRVERPFVSEGSQLIKPSG